MKDSKDHESGLIITRRDLLKGAAFTTLGVAMGLDPLRAIAEAGTKPITTVVIVRSKDVLDKDGNVVKPTLEKMLDKGMASLSGKKTVGDAWKQYIKPDDAVGIKMSRQITVTHAELTDAMTQRINAIGVKNVTTWDRDAKKPEEFTALINVPGMKTHWLSGIGVAIKNYAGCHPKPSQYHPDSCAELGAMWEYPTLKGKTRLIVIDALKVLYNGGPQVDPKYMWDYKGLIFGTDPVAVDTVCLNIIQKKRNEVQPPQWIISPPPKHIEVADKKFKLGTSDLSKIRIVELEV
jgi:hypothetical protein